jgi:hypothetical protein
VEYNKFHYCELQVETCTDIDHDFLKKYRLITTTDLASEPVGGFFKN